MQAKSLLGWIFIGIGALFLVGGLFVLIFVTTVSVSNGMALDAPPIQAPASIWVTVAERVMDFTIQLLEVEWTPTRVGIFLIVIGLVFEGGGAYLLVAPKPGREDR